MKRATLCLNMIVKNEAAVIRRCLDTVVRFIDTWVIVDTGSTDGTQDVIRRTFADHGVAGELFERPWRDFGHNRTEALALARGRADYTLVIDADEVLLTEPGFEMPELTLDAYQIVHQPGESETRFLLTQIVRSALPFRYQGVLHEVVVCDTPHRTGRIEGVVTKGLFDSARNAVDPKEKYRRDAAVLERALASAPDDPRSVFYLGQSYRDAGDLEAAVAAYRRRTAMGGWEEERWHAQLQVGLLEERLGHHETAVAELIAAFALRPTRAEPLCELARHYRERREYAAALLFAERARRTPRPDDSLFVDESVYAWRALDEHAIASVYTGDPESALETTDALLASGKVPASERARVEKNRAFYAQELAQRTGHAAPTAGRCRGSTPASPSSCSG